MLMRYEIHYGIRTYPAGVEDTPYNFIEQNEPESILVNDLLHQRLQQFVNLNVHRHTGLSFEQFMSMQRMDILAILKVAEQKCQAEDASAADLSGRLRDLSQG